MPKILAIHSYQSETGKSHLTANLAALIAFKGQQVAVIDLDFSAPCIHLLFGIDDNMLEMTINNYLLGRCSIREAVYNVSALLGIEGQGSVFLVPASIQLEETDPILSDRDTIDLLNTGLQQLCQELTLDYLLINTNPNFSQNNLRAIACANLLLLVLSPDRQDEQSLFLLIDAARQLGIEEIQLVFEQVPSAINVALFQQNWEQTYNIPIIGILPQGEEQLLHQSREIFCLQYPDHPFTLILNNLANQLIN